MTERLKTVWSQNFANNDLYPYPPPLNFLVHLVVSVWVSHRVGPQRSLTGNEREVKVN